MENSKDVFLAAEDTAARLVPQNSIRNSGSDSTRSSMLVAWSGSSVSCGLLDSAAVEVILNQPVLQVLHAIAPDTSSTPVLACHMIPIQYLFCKSEIWFIILLCIYVCAGSSLLHVGFLQLQRAGPTLQLRCAGFSLRWLLLLQSTVSRRAGAVVVACGIIPDHGLDPCLLH